MLIPLLTLGELQKHPLKVVDLLGKNVLLVRSKGDVHIISALCPHRGAPLKDAYLIEGFIVCSWHRSVFDLATGTPTSGPCQQTLKVWKAVILDEMIYADLSGEERSQLY